MKMLLAAFALVSATAASAEPATGSAVGFDQDLMIVGIADPSAVTAPVLPTRPAPSLPTNTQRRVAQERSLQDEAPAA